jgi:hypothetical protein
MAAYTCLVSRNWPEKYKLTNMKQRLRTKIITEHVRNAELLIKH